MSAPRDQTFRESFYGCADGALLDDDCEDAEQAYEVDGAKHRESFGIVAREKRTNRTARAFFKDMSTRERRRS